MALVIVLLMVATLGAPFGIAAAIQARGGRRRKALWLAAGIVFGPYAVLAQYFFFHEHPDWTK